MAKAFFLTRNKHVVKRPAKILDLFPPFSNRRSQSTTDGFHMKIQNRKRPHKQIMIDSQRSPQKKKLDKSRQLDLSLQEKSTQRFVDSFRDMENWCYI